MSVAMAEQQASRFFSGFTIFLRAVALLCLLAGMQYWVRLIGVEDGELWRFDLMPMIWQLASVSLAVLYPVCAVGLWMLAPWGAVIWFVAAVSEVVMYGLQPEIFGQRPEILIIHALIALIYLAFRGALFYESRKLQQEA